ncbi:MULTISPECIES: DUF4244 domain-containing protein [unclassified Actinopolyspora]|uniref:DUF4244 domain-containing protein n=1 Tax=Actinopolyspora TaxID=1849 RepID=UPI0013F695E8|nr:MULTISPECIES: DUF4244 domain-containing protein [unclassified Actinopolyspora]NHD19169.1 DUF4244 domain-containing protein [Actinopolyspora sp. BKK2]NHE78293.1 DUF4244 domain-containing protein [Actinopolyspora sp. BKK1]
MTLLGGVFRAWWCTAVLGTWLFGAGVIRSRGRWRRGPARTRGERGLRTPVLHRVLGGDEGMSTAEYAVGTIAAAAFAGLLYTIVTSDAVTEALTSLLRSALSQELG